MAPRRRSLQQDPRRFPGVPERDVIIHGDAQFALRSLPAESVHLAITSPPYNLKIPYAGYTDDRRADEYLRWLRAVWKDLERVLKEGTEPERRAAALALRASPDPGAARLLQGDAVLAKAIAGGELTWERVVATA